MTLHTLLLAAALAFAGPGAPAAQAEAGPHWVGTWAAAPQPPLTGTLATYDNQSLRLIVHTSAGGSQLRVRISNAFGDAPLLIGAAHVARRVAEARIDPATDRALRFGGQPSVTVAPHATVWSDPVELEVPALADLAISLHLPRRTAAATTHFFAQQTSYAAAAKGDLTGAAEFPVGRKIQSWPFVTGIDVAASPKAVAVVAFGDSLIDGDGSTPDANRRWPDVLAARLQAEGREAGVLNGGLIGNRLLKDSPRSPKNPGGPGFGRSGLARFDQDALAQSGARVVIVRIGLNDIGFPGAFASPRELPSAAALIAGYRQLIARAHAKGLRIVGTTSPPFEAADLAPGYYTPQKETLRQAVNEWIRHGGAFDAVVDFDAVLRDPAHPTRLAPAFDSGDHLHPNDAGYAALVDAMPASLFDAASAL